MKIAVGADHAGYELKEKLVNYLKNHGHSVSDFGTDSGDSTDYPDYAFMVAGSVAKGDNEMGILVCWTGNGMAMAANKVNGIRAALCINEHMAELARQHNDANILCLPSLFVSEEGGYKILDKFLNSEFQEGRHRRRISKIADYERGGR